VNQTLLSQYSFENEYHWFESQKITLPEDYSIEKNRDSLSTLFTFSDLNTYGGADLNAICERLTKSKEWFSMYDVKADRFYSQILTRNRFLRNILTSIHPNHKVGAQIRLFFELQAAFVIECMDLFKIMQALNNLNLLKNTMKLIILITNLESYLTTKPTSLNI